ncbi:nuclease [Brevibacterium phage LuckyBarnes]|uniref:Nuclease n=1 Tax=Brevibacterium phage LuckyBarnes TaxID=2027888 RepID=A0A249XQD2_9CAUD|nr:endonuclease [Brevibacterium phage LuckyBarnes]ASZ73384.1 nuclease [Brevibacterium phage LuckyBarnes]
MIQIVLSLVTVVTSHTYARAKLYSMRESSVESKLHRGVLKLGGLSYKWVPIIAGLPDRVVLLPGGRVYFIELKATDGKLRPDQLVMHEKFRKRGIDVVVLTGPAEVDRWLNERNREQ